MSATDEAQIAAMLRDRATDADTFMPPEPMQTLSLGHQALRTKRRLAALGACLSIAGVVVGGTVVAGQIGGGDARPGPADQSTSSPPTEKPSTIEPSPTQSETPPAQPEVRVTKCADLLARGWQPPSDEVPDISWDPESGVTKVSYSGERLVINIFEDPRCKELPDVGRMISQIVERRR